MRLSKVLKTLRSQLQRKPSLNPTLTAQTPPPPAGGSFQAHTTTLTRLLVIKWAIT